MDGRKKKVGDLIVIAGIYLLAFALAAAAAFWIEDTVAGYLMFDAAATVIVFVFSAALHNSSVYDAYWSAAPMVMSVYLFVRSRAFSPWQILFLLVFNLWSARLTGNWITVTTGFSYEDWRYRKLREENPPLLWCVINFFGIHMVPTLVVFAGMLPLFEIVNRPMNALCLPGIAVMVFGILLEFFADRQMRAFLQETASAQTKSVCRRGLWRFSRHPNYLGEISVWAGVYLTMLPFAPTKWYYGIGFAAVAVLFNAVSIPMMEKRQLARRPEYAAYRAQTSRLLLLPVKK